MPGWAKYNNSFLKELPVCHSHEIMKNKSKSNGSNSKIWRLRHKVKKRKKHLTTKIAEGACLDMLKDSTKIDADSALPNSGNVPKECRNRQALAPEGMKKTPNPSSNGAKKVKKSKSSPNPSIPTGECGNPPKTQASKRKNRKKMKKQSPLAKPAISTGSSSETSRPERPSNAKTHVTSAKSAKKIGNPKTNEADVAVSEAAIESRTGRNPRVSGMQKSDSQKRKNSKNDSAEETNSSTATDSKPESTAPPTPKSTGPPTPKSTGPPTRPKSRREKFKNSKESSLRTRMLSRLSAARFRYLNEQLYTWDGRQSADLAFTKDPKTFEAYHSGFRQQAKLWPINPVDSIIKSIRKMPDYRQKVVADFGCGEAKLALELAENKVYSFDLVALNDRVTVADNGNTNLFARSVDVAVHCLSLMSSNISSYLREANRVLRVGGVLKIAEVESRFENVDKFVDDVAKFNFRLVKKDLSKNLFYFLDFEKTADIGVARKRKLPDLSLLPCMYKKR